MDAIVYTSNTGFTEKYAKLLGGKLFLPVYSLEEAKGKLAAGAEIIYLGWLMAGTVKGYKPAVRRYRIRAVGAVGMAATGTNTDQVRKSNHLPEKIPVFTLQGGYDSSRLNPGAQSDDEKWWRRCLSRSWRISWIAHRRRMPCWTCCARRRLCTGRESGRAFTVVRDAIETK